MWILPKNLHTSAYVPDTVALISDLNEQSEMCEQSLLVRSKPMRSRTWSKKWKRDSWTQHLFGRILKHSHGKIFTEKWTSCLEASLVNHLVTQVGKQEMMTLDTCGHTSSGESNNWDDLPLFSSKTWKESSTQNSNQTGGQIRSERLFCSMSLESWKKWVTKQRQAYLVRAKSQLLSSANESLYLQYQTNSNLVDVMLSQVSSTESMSSQNELLGIMQETTEQRTHLLEDNSSTDTKPQEQSPKGYLNPRWVEQLMGLPVGWAKASCSVVTITEQMSLDYLGTELCQTQPQERSDSYGKNWPTPNARDWKDSHTIPPCIGKTRGLTLGMSLVEESQQTKQKNWTTPTSREVRADSVTLDTLIRKDGKHRLDQLGIQVRFDERDVEEAYKKRWGTPTSRIILDDGFTTETLVRKDGKNRLGSLGVQVRFNEKDLEEAYKKKWATPTARDWKGPQGRFYKSGTKDLPAQVEFGGIKPKKWSTPPASQRGEDLEVYFRKSIDRVKNGGVKFAPTLQVQVEAEQKKISLDFADHDIDLSIDTETLVKKIMGVHYKKEEDQ